MVESRKPTNSTLVGILVTVIICVMIAIRIMEDNDGSSINLSEFFSDPKNSVFVLYYGAIIFSSWLIKGYNNPNSDNKCTTLD